MSPSDIERLAREADELGRAVFSIAPLSRTRPHVFAEDKDALSNRLHALARELRSLSGGAMAGQSVGHAHKLNVPGSVVQPRDTRLDGIAGRVCFPAVKPR